MKDHNSNKLYNECKEWIFDEYFSSLGEEISRNIGHMYTPANWGITIITSTIIFVISQDNYPSNILLFALLISLTVSNHFFTLSLKGYINVLRYSTLRKKIIHLHLMTNYKKNDVDKLKEDIDTYEVQWKLPVARKTIILKSCVDLGFGLIQLLAISSIIYTSLQLSFSNFEIVIVGGLIAINIGIYINFMCSPYMKTKQVDELAKKLR